ncbi:MAG: amino acid adenylation domain-containing protein [Granulosicoccus sp.]
MNTQKRKVTDSVCEILFQLSGIELDDRNSASSFIELGFDSLFLIQFSTRIKKELGVDVTFRQMLSEISTTELLINHIDSLAEPKLSSDTESRNIAEDIRTNTAVNDEKARIDPDESETEEQLDELKYRQSQSSAVTDSNVDFSSHESIYSNTVSQSSKTQLESIISKQLDIMSQQLTALTGRTVPGNVSAEKKYRKAGTKTTRKANTVAAVRPPVSKPLHAINITAPETIDGAKRESSTINKPQPFGAIARIQTGASDTLSDAQRDWLIRFTHRYNTKTEKSKAFTERYRDVHADPRVVSGFKPALKELVYPIVAKRTNGCRIWDQDDNEYIDALNGFGSNYFGYADPDITKAVVNQLWQGSEIGPQNPLTGEAAKLICEFTGMDRVGFCNTGSEAVMGAMRIARTVTGKDLIVIFSGSYHGIFDEVIVRGTPQLHSVPAAPGITDDSVKNVLVLEYGSEESISIIKNRINDIAAVMVEPVQSRRPQFQPREFLHTLRTITEEHDVPFIFDEVITGFRTAPGGAQEFFNIKADIATYGKVVGGGMQIGVVAGRRKYMDALDGGTWKFGDRSEPQEAVTYFAGTFVRHPASIAACVAALKILKNGGPELQQNTNIQTAELVKTLNSFFVETGAPIKINYFGSLWRMEFEETSSYGDLLFYLIRDKGIHIYDRFPCFLTLKHTEEDVNSIVNAIKESVVELQKVGFIESKKKTSDELLAKRAPVTDYPLTRIQSNIWLTSQFSEEGNIAYNEPVLLKLSGKCDLIAIQNAIKTVYQRHDALHARFSPDGNFQQFPAPAPLQLPLHDLSQNDTDTSDKKLEELVDKISRAPFDLSIGPLVRIEIVRLADDKTVLICSAHHIVCDGWSWNTLLCEIGTVYNATVNGVTHRFEGADSFRDFVTQDYEYNLDVKDARLIDHWVKQLSNTPIYLDLPTDRVRTPVKKFNGDTIKHHLPEDTYRALKVISGRENTSLFTVLSSVFMILISRISQQQKIVISTPVAGQMLSGKFDLVGCCIRLLPIAADIDEDQSYIGFLNKMKTIILDGFENINTDFTGLLKEQQSNYKSNRTAFSEVCFNLDRDEAGIEFGRLTSTVEQATKIAVINDIFFNVNEGRNGLKIDCDFNTALYDRSTIQRWIKSFEVLLCAVTQAPEASIKSLNSMPSDERGFLLQHAQAERLPVPISGQIDQIFDQKASEIPEAIATISGEEKLTYSQIYQQSNMLANHLRHMGVESGNRLGIYLDRSPLCLIAILGVMKTGGICIPLDPLYPVDRIRLMIEDSEANLILTSEKILNDQLKNNSIFVDKLFALDKNWPDISKQPREFVGDKNTRQKTALILYTSASTGKPAGVRTLHSAHLRRFEWMWRQFPFSEADLCCQKTSLCFVDSVWELFGPLLKGVPNVFISEDTLIDTNKFIDVVDENRISRIVLVPSLLRLLIASARHKDCRLPALRYCFSSGEILPVDLAQEFNLQFPDCKLVNLYGTTEVSGDATYHEFDPVNDKQKVAIGRPIDNSSVYLLDSYRNLVPQGSIGEICIGGEILSADYNNHEQLSADRFITGTFTDVDLEDSQSREIRLFRTGDLGRVLINGSVEYVGRKDMQIQVNGIRIDPAEVEAVIESHKTIAQCLIEFVDSALSNTGSGNRSRQLVAYLRTHHNVAIDVADIRDHVKRLLPQYMVPQQFFQLSSFPLTPNGKINREQLSKQPVSVLVNTVKTRMPRTQAEKILLQVWSEGLGLDDINMEDSYFDLGSSFTLIKIISALYEKHGISIAIQDFLHNPTLENLASYIEPQIALSRENAQFSIGERTIISLQEGSDMTPLLLIPPAGVTEIYFMPMLSKMDASIPVYSISPDEIMNHQSITAYARHLAEEWTQLCPGRRCVVAGMCMGTHLAFELTNQLLRKGHDVQLLTVIDHDAPETSVGRIKHLFSAKGPMAPAVRALQHLKAGRLGRLYLRASIAIERNFDKDLDHYMKLLEWQNKISSDYEAVPCNTDILLIQSEEYSESRNLAQQWLRLTTGSLVVETLDSVLHDDFTEDEPEPLYRVATVLDRHFRNLVTKVGPSSFQNEQDVP